MIPSCSACLNVLENRFWEKKNCQKFFYINFKFFYKGKLLVNQITKKLEANLKKGSDHKIPYHRKYIWANFGKLIFNTRKVIKTFCFYKAHNTPNIKNFFVFFIFFAKFNKVSYLKT